MEDDLRFMEPFKETKMPVYELQVFVDDQRILVDGIRLELSDSESTPLDLLRVDAHEKCLKALVYSLQKIGVSVILEDEPTKLAQITDEVDIEKLMFAVKGYSELLITILEEIEQARVKDSDRVPILRETRNGVARFFRSFLEIVMIYDSQLGLDPRIAELLQLIDSE